MGRFEINISIYRGQPRFDSIITGETHERSFTAYGCEVPDTPVKITVAELPETTVMHKKMSALEVGRHRKPPVMAKVSTTGGYHFASKSWKWGKGKNTVLGLSLNLYKTNATK